MNEQFCKRRFLFAFSYDETIINRTAKDACTWLILIKEELGNRWLQNGLFRCHHNFVFALCDSRHNETSLFFPCPN